MKDSAIYILFVLLKRKIVYLGKYVLHFLS